MTDTTERVNLLDLLTADRTLPDGCDRWGIRTVHPDLRSSHDYRWPYPGQWAEAPGPILDHTRECPSAVGDGICVAHTWAGMASRGLPAVTLLLCAYASADLLSPAGRDKVRLRRVYVVDLVDGTRLMRGSGAGANLAGANLAGANLAGANLAGANLAGANLTRANLAGANLTDAVYTSTTRWPDGYRPSGHGARQVT